MPLAEQARAIREKTLPDSHWLRQQTNGVLGAILVSQGRAAEGRPLIEHAISAMRDALPEGDLRIVEVEGLLRVAGSCHGCR